MKCEKQEEQKRIDSRCNNILAKIIPENRIVKLTVSAMYVALTVVLSALSIPVGVMRCYPVQHFINVLSAITLGPEYSILIAFVTSLIRNILGTGTLLAFPGSMVGALCCGMVFKYTQKYYLTYLAEIIGTGIVGGLIAFPVAAFVMGKKWAVYAFLLPFLVSTIGGTIIAAILIGVLRKIKFTI